MTDFEAYQEYIQRKHNAFCKAVIRYAARDKILQLRRKWERQISLDYLMDEKFVQFAGPEPDEEYPFTVCGQTVLLCNAALAAALSAQPKQTQEVILRYYFLRHYAGYIRYFSKVNGQVNAEVEDYVKQRLIDCQFKFRFDYPPDEP